MGAQAPEGFRLEQRLPIRHGEVYAAVRESDEREVLLKRYPAKRSASHVRVVQEREILRVLDGRGAMQVLELLETESPPVLVLERARGVSLAEWVRSGPLGPRDFLEVAIQLTEALGHVHDAHYIRCDVHPGNVRVDPPTRQMLADALGRSEEDVVPLARQVEQKTGSNPLLIQQFVLHMHAMHLIRFVSPAGWSWDDAAIAAADVSEGAIPLFMAKLDRLQPDPRELIEFASCVGDEFDIEHLTELSGHPPGRVEPSLLLLLQEGLIAPSPRGFRFVHDRIREAAHELIPVARSRALHLGVARFLSSTLSPEVIAENIFEIADHWTEALEMLEPSDRFRALRINVAAGSRALAAGSAKTASSYFGVARSLFREADLGRDPKLAFEIFANAAESAH